MYIHSRPPQTDILHRVLSSVPKRVMYVSESTIGRRTSLLFGYPNKRSYSPTLASVVTTIT